MQAELFKNINLKFWPVFKESFHSDQNSLGERYNEIFIALFCFAAITGLIFINNDLWQDELYSLDNFILVPVSKTISDYHSTNNHIVFNLISNIYLKIFKITSLEFLLINPVIIRLIPYSFSLLSVWLFYLFTKKIFGQVFSISTICIYITSTQFYTFGSQVRGYSLDILLWIILLNFIFRFHQKASKSFLLYISTSGTLILINLPSSLYLYVSLTLLLFIDSIRKNKATSIDYFKTNSFKLFVSLLISFILFTIFYLFKFSQISHNELLYNSGNPPFSLIKQPFAVYFRFFDYRSILFIPLFVLTPLLNIKFTFSVLLLGLLLLPFLLFAFHNPVIILRIWIIILPVFCIFIASFCNPLLLLKKWIFPTFIITLILTSIISLFILKYQTIQLHKKNIASLDLKYQYHLFNFNAYSISSKAKQLSKKYNAKIILYDQTLSGIKYYLPKKNILSFEEIKNNDQAFILISDKEENSQRIHEYTYHNIDSTGNYPNQFFKLYLLKKIYD